MTASARCAVLISLFIVFLASSVLAQQPLKFDAATVSGLPARNIGSATMSGRIAALDAAVRNGRLTMFVGSASGGVWKSVNGGTTFKPVFDRQDVQSIGAVTIDPSHPEIVWVGTGESWVRNSVSVGDGIYKSTDGDRKSTRLNSSHGYISYAVFCLKKKKHHRDQLVHDGSMLPVSELRDRPLVRTPSLLSF